MGNPFDEMSNWAGWHGTDYNQNAKAVTDTANDITLATPGVWKITCDVAVYFRGPTAATAAATNASQHWRKDQDILIVTKDASQHVSLLRVGGTSGTAYCSLLAPGPA